MRGMLVPRRGAGCSFLAVLLRPVLGRRLQCRRLGYGECVAKKFMKPAGSGRSDPDRYKFGGSIDDAFNQVVNISLIAVRLIKDVLTNVNGALSLMAGSN